MTPEQPTEIDAFAPTAVVDHSDQAVDPTAKTVDASASAPVARDLPPPGEATEKIGRFVILDTLGSGGMGRVYAAWDSKLGRRIALKVLRPDVFGDSTEARGRLLAEARAMAQLSHPNVVSVHDVLESDGQVVIAMEYVDGGTLRTLLESRPSRDRVLDVMVDAGRGLAAAHGRGILHRDFKPENVLIGKDGRPRVADFGIASFARMESEEGASPPSLKGLPTTLTTVAGTLGYMAPEVLRREPIGAMSDQFSFCVTVWEALAGVLPLENRSRTTAVGIEPSIRSVLERGMSDEPKARHPSMEALLQALARARGARARRMRSALMAIVGAAAVAGAGLYLRREASACSEGDALSALAWGPVRRNEVARAFEQEGIENALQMQTDLASRVTERAEAWRVGYRSTCQELRRAEPLQQTALAGRLACFEQRLHMLHVVTARWASAKPEALARSPFQVDALQQYDDCPVGTTDGYTILPDDPKRAAEARALRSELDGLSARWLTMTSADQEALLADLRRIAERGVEAGDHFTVAGARRLEGRIACENGAMPRDCLGALATAATEALAANDATTATHALSHLARELADVGRSDEAKFAAALAQALLQRLYAPPSLSAEHRVRMGSMHHLFMDLPAAELETRRGLDERRRLFGADSLETAQAINNLAGILHDAGQLAEGEQLYREALGIRTRRLGPKHSSRIVLLHNLGAIYIDMDRFTEALEVLDEGLSQMPTTAGKVHPRRHFMERLRAAAFLGLGRIDEGEASAREALQQCEALRGRESPDCARPLIVLAEVALARGKVQPDTAQSIERAVRLAGVRAKTGPLLARALLVQANVLVSSDQAAATMALQRAEEAVPKGSVLAPSVQRYRDTVKAALERK